MSKSRQSKNPHASRFALAMGMSMLLVVAFSLIACAPASTPIPPTAPPPTAAPTNVQPTATLVAAFQMNAALDKYITDLPDGFGAVKPDALKDQLAAAKPFILDVREASEVQKDGYIPGAVNIPIRTLGKNLDKLPAKDQPIVAYCANGHRGALAMMTLQMLGYANVKSLAGGLNAWKAANLTVANAALTAPVAGTAPAVDEDLLAALDKYLTALPDGYGTIKPDAFKNQLAGTKPFLLDVREVKQVSDGGKIESSVNVPIRTLFKNLNQLPQDKTAPIVVYCGIGHNGALVMATLQMLGYTSVKSLAGGFSAWTKAGYPVVKAGN